MRTRAIAVVAAAVAMGGLGAGNAPAATPSGISIHYKRPSRLLYGFVFSDDLKRCADDRRAKVFRQKGDKQTRRDAKLVGYVRATRHRDGKYQWRLRGPLQPLRAGKYFAYMNNENGCQGDYSKTIHISVPHPNTKITGMAIHRRSHRVTFHYVASGGTKPYTFRCFLDGVKHYCKRDGKTFVNVSRGRHVFKVKAVDDRGRRDLSPARRKFQM